jgi:hypothetical protein
MMNLNTSMFAQEERGNRRSKLGDPPVGFAKHVDFMAIANAIKVFLPRPPRAKGGRPPYSAVWMAKTLVLQQLYNLPDDAMEYQLLDCRSFLQFFEITESSTIPPGPTGAGIGAVHQSALLIGHLPAGARLQHRPAAARFKVRKSALAQGFEAAPAIQWAQRHQSRQIRIAPLGSACRRFAR